MSLDMSNWKEFRFGDLISDIYKAKAINKDDLTIAIDSDNAIRYITRTGENNGCELLADIRDIDSKMIEKGNAISIGDTTATCFYQAEDFITGDHMVVVRADSWLNPYTALYVVAILTNEQYKYSYGRAYLMDRIKDTMIKLPTDSNSNPDWQFMEDYIKSLHHKPLTTKNKSGQTPALNVHDWGEFRVGDIFPKKKVKHFSAMPEIEGITPFISSTSVNNGVAAYVDEDGIEGNCITVSTNGDCFDCFYQPNSIALSNDAEALYNANLNKYNAMFVISVLTLEKIKYGYGRKPKNDKVYDTIIKLPVDKNGKPDWQFMEDYIKALPYGDRLVG